MVVDVGTGCGAVALALATARPDARVHATDLSVLAVRNARRNRRRLGLRGVRVHGGSLLEPLSSSLRGLVAAIVANVPYVPPAAVPSGIGLMPLGTFEGTEEDGLGLVRELAVQARAFLEPGGWLVLQVADHHRDGLSRWLEAHGYESVRAGERRPGGAITVLARSIGRNR